jgi:2-methylcitrate dehydratase
MDKYHYFRVLIKTITCVIKKDERVNIINEFQKDEDVRVFLLSLKSGGVGINLTAADYEDQVAADSQIDALRERMEVVENQQFTKDYLDPAKRSIGNAVQVFFKDGSSTEKVTVEYPIGHRRRRQEGIPVLQRKFERNLATRLSPKNCAKLVEICAEQSRLENTPVNEFMELMVI